MKSLLSIATDESKLAEYMTGLAKATESVMPAGCGKFGRCSFTIVIWDDGVEPQYVSNGDYKESVSALRAVANRVEKNKLQSN